MSANTAYAFDSITNISPRVITRTIDEGNKLRTITLKQNFMKSEVIGQMDRVVKGKGFREQRIFRAWLLPGCSGD
jgi:hypothetical protein